MISCIVIRKCRKIFSITHKTKSDTHKIFSTTRKIFGVMREIFGGGREIFRRNHEIIWGRCDWRWVVVEIFGRRGLFEEWWGGFWRESVVNDYYRISFWHWFIRYCGDCGDFYGFRWDCWRYWSGIFVYIYGVNKCKTIFTDSIVTTKNH